MSNNLVGLPDDGNLFGLDIANMTPQQLEQVQHQIYEKKFSLLDIRVATVEKIVNEKELNSRQRKKLRSRVNQIVVGYLGGNKSHAYRDNSTRSTAYSRLYNFLYDCFEVSEYSDLPANKFQDVMATLNQWEPDVELKERVNLLNGQGQLFN